MLAGDVGLVSNRGLAEWLIRFGEQRKYGRGSPEARWNHVWMAVSDIEVIEAKGGGVRIAPYADYAQSFHTIFRPPYGPAGAELVAVNAMRAMLGERYGWLTIASEALIFATGTRIRFGIEGSQICSGAVASALALAGVDMIPTSHMAIQPWLGEEWSSPADIAAVAREQRWLPVPR